MSSQVAFYLLGYKGFVVLKDFLNKFQSEIINCIIIAEDSSIENDYFLEITQLCKRNKITYYRRREETAFEADLIFAVGWRWLINKKTNKLIVLHDSLLPRYRGFNPLVTALLNKDRTIGVTALFASEEYDKGDIILQKSINIEYPIKLIHAIEKIAYIYSDIIIEICNDFLNDKNIKATKQNDINASYSLWRDDFDYKIDWKKSAEFISRFVDSVGYPYAGAQTTIEGKSCIIVDSEAIEDVLIENRTVGKIIFIENGFPIVVCGQGLLKILKIIHKDTKEDLLPLNKFRIRFI